MVKPVTGILFFVFCFCFVFSVFFVLYLVLICPPTYRPAGRRGGARRRGGDSEGRFFFVCDIGAGCGRSSKERSIVCCGGSLESHDLVISAFFFFCPVFESRAVSLARPGLAKGTNHTVAVVPQWVVKKFPRANWSAMKIITQPRQELCFCWCRLLEAQQISRTSMASWDETIGLPVI